MSYNLEPYCVPDSRANKLFIERLGQNKRPRIFFLLYNDLFWQFYRDRPGVFSVEGSLERRP